MADLSTISLLMEIVTSLNSVNDLAYLSCCCVGSAASLSYCYKNLRGWAMKIRDNGGVVVLVLRLFPKTQHSGR